MVSHRKPAKPAFDPRTVKENIVETPLNEEMSKSFLEYAYSVIYARALPDARYVWRSRSPCGCHWWTVTAISVLSMTVLLLLVIPRLVWRRPRWA